MSEKSRAKLKEYFEAGQIPTEDQFADLIDSTLNKGDDGISASTGDDQTNIGIGISNPDAPLSINTYKNKLVQFLKKSDKTWEIELDADNNLIILNSDTKENYVILKTNGKVGIGTTETDSPLGIKPDSNSKVIGIESKEANKSWEINNTEGEALSIETPGKSNILHLTTEGAAGIGTGTPKAPLTIKEQEVNDEKSLISFEGANPEEEQWKISHTDTNGIKIHNSTNQLVMQKNGESSLTVQGDTDAKNAFTIQAKNFPKEADTNLLRITDTNNAEVFKVNGNGIMEANGIVAQNIHLQSGDNVAAIQNSIPLQNIIEDIGTKPKSYDENSDKLVTMKAIQEYIDNLFVGSISAFSFSEDGKAPAGWLVCDGGEYLIEDYPILHKKIETDYGGSGNKFKVPDLRGYFIRGWSKDDTENRDPDKSNRNGGNTIGSTQKGEVGEHRHGIQYFHGYNKRDFTENVIGNADESKYEYTQYTNYYPGSETRPVNIYMMYCIKY